MSKEQKTELPVNGLVVLLKENNVSEETALAISPAFTELYDLANEWNTKASEYLSDETLDPIEKAKQAKKARLALVKVRTGIDKKRKELNDEDQKRITDRNSAAKVLTGLVTPTEALLEEVEKKQENEEKERKTKLKNERLEKLTPFNVDCTFFDLENMPDEAFAVLLENSSLAHQKRLDYEKKLQEKQAFEKRTSERKDQLVLLGFKPHESGAYTHELFDVHEEIEAYPDEQWKNFTDKLAKEISDLIEIKRLEKEAEDNRLKAEKEEAERKNLLLEQQEKERQHKHNNAIFRQEAFLKIGVNFSYDMLYKMEDPDFQELYQEKKNDYDIQQNKLFIEKKKKEREEAIEKEKQDRVQKRIDELSKLDFIFHEKTELWYHSGINLTVSLKEIETVTDEVWVNDNILYINEKLKEKRDADLAPDKNKLSVFFNKVYETVKQFEGNEFKDPEAERIYKNYFGMMERANQWAEEQINKLK